MRTVLTVLIFVQLVAAHGVDFNELEYHGFEPSTAEGRLGLNEVYVGNGFAQAVPMGFVDFAKSLKKLKEKKN